ncbi:unnamed protein product [Notodromas monacha]|uniref:RING-type E3 ubiquitin-protein ligase PPIL2 n=1 Tax=Notodromas monacha TaxID=399045 RepID=A0A7R9GFF5_9CRUS|nr:unnamed protein product [Notodromas monacha]CAG0918790.1 unnamed protein product [Notodromas monacha]
MSDKTVSYGKIKSSLGQFLEENRLPSKECLASLDDIILGYVVGVLEDIAQEDDNFDVDDFMEMISAYCPSISSIPKSRISYWAHSLALELKSTSGEPRKKIVSLLDLECSLPQIVATCNGTTRPSRISKNSESSMSSDDSSISSQYSAAEEEICALKELFPSTSTAEIKHCLAVANGDIQDAAQWVLQRQETGESIKAVPKFSKDLITNDDESVKKHIISKYSYVDQDEDKKEYRPPPPKFEPKKLVRYRENQIVTVKGERFTEVKSKEDEDMKKTYVNLKPSRQYRYLTTTEWTTLYGGRSAVDALNEARRRAFRRLPYSYCCLTLNPFENPVCDNDGNVFELLEIVPFVKKFKKNPVTGKPLDMKNLFKLHFHKNEDGEYQCPVLFRSFTNNSEIVAIKTTGNVYSREAVEQLNIKTKNWKDLLNDEPFARTDIIEIQSPNNLEKSNVSDFYHVKHNLRTIVAEDDGKSTLKSSAISSDAKAIVAEMEKIVEKDKDKFKPETSDGKTLDKFNAAHYSTGTVAAGLTSTYMAPETRSTAAILEDDVVRYARIKKKGYVRLVTNYGQLNLEVFCDQVPKTSENFIKLCASGYYNGTKFHRSIRHFMIQGGDPTGKGTGGESFWKTPFKDEFKPNLNHAGRGVLSMANSGPNTNKSQFFITFRSCRHLDNKHSVFGKVVGGLDNLTDIENVGTDNEDRPVEDIIVLNAQVFVDPFQEVDELLAKEREAEAKKKEEEKEEYELGVHGKKRADSKSSAEPKVFRSGVGRYIDPKRMSTKSSIDAPSTSTSAIEEPPPEPKKKKRDSAGFSNFSSWLVASAAGRVARASTARFPVQFHQTSFSKLLNCNVPKMLSVIPQKHGYSTEAKGDQKLAEFLNEEIATEKKVQKISSLPKTLGSFDLTVDNSDQKLAEFLNEEIATEKKVQKISSLPKTLGSFDLTVDNSRIVFQRTIRDEVVKIELNVNHSVETAVPEGSGQSDSAPEMLSKPNFDVEIKKGDSTITFSCSFTAEDFSPEQAQQNDEGFDLFTIDEVCIFEKEWRDETYAVSGDILDEEWRDETYAVSGDILDEYLYDLLMNMLEERGVSNEFVEKLQEFCTGYEHSLYIKFLESLKKFAGSS